MQIDQNNPAFNAMQNVKRRMFALRNGIVADALRRAGDPHRIIFGLTLPQISEIAMAAGTDSALADMLWANDTTRESRLLAPYLYDKQAVDISKAMQLATSVVCVEEADILCHRLLRHLPFALEIIENLDDNIDDLQRYTALRLAFNTASQHPDVAMQVAKNEFDRNCPLTRTTAIRLIDECEFLLKE